MYTNIIIYILRYEYIFINMYHAAVQTLYIFTVIVYRYLVLYTLYNIRILLNIIIVKQQRFMIGIIHVINLHKHFVQEHFILKPNEPYFSVCKKYKYLHVYCIITQVYILHYIIMCSRLLNTNRTTCVSYQYYYSEI